MNREHRMGDSRHMALVKELCALPVAQGLVPEQKTKDSPENCREMDPQVGFGVAINRLQPN